MIDPKAQDRFWSKVDKSAGDDGCWLWTGTKSPFGYGRFFARKTNLRAHRASYEIHFGEIESGLVICHKCDQPSCVNPAHLFAGTQNDNLQDMTAKRRHWAHQLQTCKYGHPFDAVRSYGVRDCSVCVKKRQAEGYSRNGHVLKEKRKAERAAARAIRIANGAKR